MAKRVYPKAHKTEDVVEIIRDLFEHIPRINYKTLMARYGEVLVWGRRSLKDKQEVQEQIDEIKRRCLEVTVRKLAKKENISPTYIARNHAYILSNAENLYESIDGKRSLQLLIEAAGLTYRSRNWGPTLPGTLERTIELIEEYDTYSKEDLLSLDYPSTRNAVKFVGSFGRVVMLLGIDYLNLKLSRKKNKCQKFSLDLLTEIYNDPHLDKGSAIRYIFNALTLQYYDHYDDSNKAWFLIEYESIDSPYFKQWISMQRKKGFFKSSVQLRLQTKDNPYKLFRIHLHLNDAEAKHKDAAFYFHGEIAESKALRHYNYLVNILQKIQES